MKEHPILFSTEMVKAILDGRKSQTRRVMKPQPNLVGGEWFWRKCSWTDEKPRCPTGTLELAIDYCPHGEVGDRLWCRETWRIYSADEGTQSCEYKADLPNPIYTATPWRPPIFMPRWASRITLEITGIRVQRVQEISEGDIKCEGVVPQTYERGDGNTVTTYDFRKLWDSINIKRGYGWGKNPWCWCIEFKRC